MLQESCGQMGISMLELALFPILLLADTILSFAPDEHIIQLQAHVRRFLCRRRFLALRSRAIKLQSWARMLPHRALFTRTRFAAVTIQHAVRRYLSRSYRRARLLALATFQAIVRRRFTQRQYQTLLHSARPRTPSPSSPPFLLPFILLLQRFARRCLALQRRARWLHALTRLQALARGRLLRQQYLRTLDATLCLQCYIRRFLVSQHTHLLLLDHSAVTLQAAIRGYLARLCFLRARRLASYLQPLVRRYLASKTHRTLIQSVITIQAAVRGYAARLYVAMVRSRKQRNKMRAMVRAWCVQTAGVDGGAVRRFWQDMVRCSVLSVYQHCRFILDVMSAPWIDLSGLFCFYCLAGIGSQRASGRSPVRATASAPGDLPPPQAAQPRGRPRAVLGHQQGQVRSILDPSCLLVNSICSDDFALCLQGEGREEQAAPAYGRVLGLPARG